MDTLIRKGKGIILVISIVCLAIYGWSFFGDSNCGNILIEGDFIDSNTYQPTGCKLHLYTASDVKKCLVEHHKKEGGRPLVTFIGDSRIRQQFMSIIILMTDGTYKYHTIHEDLFYNISKDYSSLEFRWRPRNTMATIFSQWSSIYKGQPPKYVVIGNALHFIGGSKSEAERKGKREYFEATLQDTVKGMVATSGTEIIWKMQDPCDKGKEIDIYNQIAERILKKADIPLWTSGKAIAIHYRNESVTSDGNHVGPHALYWSSQLLTNYMCNEILHPVDATCCKHWTMDGLYNTFTVPLCLALIICVKVIWTKLKSSLYKVPVMESKSDTVVNMEGPNHVANGGVVATKEKSPKPEASVLKHYLMLAWHILKYGCILVYFYLCDRTELFSKGQKNFQPLHFYIAMATIAVLGVFTTRKSSNSDILNREQTDEWKGWMQLVILVYHYTGASKNLQIYMYIRILVSSYLFMTGYGHVMHALKHRTASVADVLWRTGEVLFRMNFLTVSLCFVMERSYQFYYFVPLVSFWYLIIMLISWLPIYIVSFIRPSSSNIITDAVAILAVTVGGFTLNSALYKHKDTFEHIFSSPLIKLLFQREDGTVHEWFFRWSLDRYTAFYGLAAGVVLLITKQYTLSERLGKCCYWVYLIVLTALSITGILLYLSVGDICTTKPDCNVIHPFACAVTILSYVTLRNLTSLVRSYHSVFFAWVGKISLELFIGQYHIWLAADTAGLLVIIPGNYIINLVLTSVIFVCVALEINSITGVVTKAIFHKLPS